jgi:hypothetical protein
VDRHDRLVPPSCDLILLPVTVFDLRKHRSGIARLSMAVVTFLVVTDDGSGHGCPDSQVG